MPHANDNDWLLVEIATGLQKLTALSLDRTPAAEMLPGTAHAWLEAVTEGREFKPERDTPRIRAAFRSLATTRETWPAPKHLIDALPRIEQSAIGYEVKPVSREEADRRMAEIRRLLDEPVPDFKPAPKPAETPAADREAIERDLQAHYATTGKAAAAGPDL